MTPPGAVRERWVTFDCYGTLVDWHGGFTEILRPIAGPRTEELIAAYHRFEGEVEGETPFRSYRSVLEETLRRAAGAIRLPLGDEEARSLPDRWDRLAIFLDVEPALAALRRDGWRLGVLTNCDEDLFAVTERSFRAPFDRVVTAEQVRDYKPSLGHFRWFARATGVAPGDWVHVACSWRHDIVPARELGLPRIWLDRDRTGEDPAAATRRIHDATVLPATVAEVLADHAAG